MNIFAATNSELPLVQDGLDPSEGALQLGNLNIDFATYKVTVDTVNANLTFQEFELLRHLADLRDRVVSFDVLSEQLWGSTGPKETRRLNVLVFRLRSKLSNSQPYRLETVRGRGYGLLNGTGKSEPHGSEGGALG